jgi:hypothetical protein
MVLTFVYKKPPSASCENGRLLPHHLQMLDFRSPRSQLVIAAFSASFLTAGLISAYTSWDRIQRRKALGRDVQHSSAAQSSSSDIERLAKEGATKDEAQFTSGIGYEEQLIREQLARNYAFFGDDAMRKIRGGNVVIVGCGGVGSWAAVMLVRS